ncbi:hypothetical protein [Methanosarcina sp. MTP4]|nr:hypothetical protein [Methanosarcina sp. MTP4]
MFCLLRNRGPHDFLDPTSATQSEALRLFLENEVNEEEDEN